MNSEWILLLQKTSNPTKPETTSAFKRLIGVVLFGVAIYLWLTSAAVYVFSIVAALGSTTASPHVPMRWLDFFIIGITSLLFIITSSNWNRIPEMLRYFGKRLEDFVGRALVVGHALCHAIIPDHRWYARKFIGWLASFFALIFIVMAFRFAVALTPEIPRSIDTGIALSHFTSPQMFLFTLVLLVATTFSILLFRFGFSRKWRMIFAKPKCDDIKKLSAFDHDNYSKFRIVHASDLHVTASQEAGLIETGQPISDDVVRKVLTSIERDASDCDAVLMTGDITDDGSASAWERFLTLCPSSLHGNLILIPGNHDLNLQQGAKADTRPFRRKLNWLLSVPRLKAERFSNFGRGLRQIRAMCVMTELMGDRALLVDRRTNRVVTLADYSRSHLASINAHISSTPGPQTPMSEIWSGMFPLVVKSGTHDVGMILLDSVKPASVNATNAIGAAPSDAISRCETLMAATADTFKCFAVAVHHHLAVPKSSSLATRFKAAFLVFENAIELVEMLVKRGEPSVVLHGHRHQEYLGIVQDSDVAVVASASATVGPHGIAADGSWRIVELAVSKGACRLLTLPVRRNLACKSDALGLRSIE